MAETRLLCLSPESARLVCEQACLKGNKDNWARVDGRTVVVVVYFDKRFAMDVAEWACDRGHADDDAASAVIASL